jgi:D-sedoheptulose 7-phosphate isomerase
MRADVEAMDGVPEASIELAVDRVQLNEPELPATNDRLVGDHQDPVAGGPQCTRRLSGTREDFELFESFDRVGSVSVEHSVPIEENYPVANLKHSSAPVERLFVDFQQAIDDHQAVMTALSTLVPDMQLVAGRMTESLRGGGTVFWFGNGGSATQSQHFATELVGRYLIDRPGLASIAITSDGALLTAVANDGTFDEIFARQLQALCRPGDVAVGLSTSGNSPNVVNGIEAARARGAFTVAITGGDGGKVGAAADVALKVPSKDTPRIQEAHLFLGHELCHLVETAIVDGERDV